MLLGPVEFVRPRGSDKPLIRANLGDIPISVRYFVEWLTSVMIAKEEIYYPLTKFMNDLINNLVKNFLNNEYIPGSIISREYQQVIELVKQYLDRQLLLGNRFFSTKKSSLSPKQVEYIRDEIFSQYKELYGKKGANTILNGHNIKDFGLTPIPDTDAKLDALRLSFTQKFVSKENATWDNIVSFMRENNQNGNQLGLFEFFNLEFSLLIALSRIFK